MVHRGYSKYLRYLLTWIDTIFLNIVNIAYGYYSNNSFDFLNDSIWLKYLIIYNIAWGLVVFINPPFNVFSDRKLRLIPLLRSVFINIIIHSILITGIVTFLGYNFYKPLILVYILFTILSTLSHWVLLIVLKWYRKKGFNYRNIILIESDNSYLLLQQHLKAHTELGYRLKKIYKHSDLNWLDFNQSKLKEYFQDDEIDEVFVNPIGLNDNMLSELINFCEDQFVKVKLLSDLGINLNRKMRPDNYGQLWLLEVSPLPLNNLENRLVKRIFDILFSLLVIVFILPWVFPIVFIFVYFESGSPLFFKQLRNGEKNKLFYCLKFRTMNINKEADKLQFSKNDKRVTKVGAFLRKTSIDELPQFINVLKGDMSVIGPRPHMIKHTEDYSKIVDRYFQRHHVKPGISGLAQVNGYRGEITNFQEIKSRVDLDKFYVENWSLALDMKILVKTIIQVFIPNEKAY